MIRLHSYWRSTAAYRVRIALNLKGLDYQQVTHDLRAGEQASAAYAAINPQKLIPTLEADELVLTQSLAIIEWLDERHPEPPLLPRSVNDRAIIVPQVGITHDQKGTPTALVVGSDNKVALRQLVTSRTYGSNWVVDSGLNPGDRVIVQGTDKVRPGMDVKTVAAQLPASSDAAAAAAPAASGAQTAQAASAASGAQ